MSFNIAAAPRIPVPAGTRPIYAIAADIRNDWTKIYFGAKPYLDAMETLTTPDEMYGQDTAKYIVSYFLGNASAYRGDTARRLKAELKALFNLK